VTSTVPTPTGTVAVQEVVLAQVTVLAGLPAPKSMAVPPVETVKPVPVMVASSPACPAFVPVAWSWTPVTVGR
jgi:hypothetical protein